MQAHPLGSAPPREAPPAGRVILATMLVVAAVSLAGLATSFGTGGRPASPGPGGSAAGGAAVGGAASPAGLGAQTTNLPTAAPDPSATTRPTPTARPTATPGPTPTQEVADAVSSGDASPGGAGSLEPAMVRLASVTIAFDPGPHTGNGVNVAIPLRRFDKLVLKPGATFDFWQAVGEVSRRTGYRLGQVVVGDHVDPNGAIGGGICVVSSALFQAAARAGLAITTRYAHGGYIETYDLGLDAAVSKSAGVTKDLVFRNDTKQTILIRTVSRRGVARVDLYAPHPIGRTVSLTDPRVSGRVTATDVRVASSSVATGQTRRVRERSDGLTVVVVRTVRDAAGRIVHRDRWVSVYQPLRGKVLVGAG